jgi:hypothetical protein
MTDTKALREIIKDSGLKSFPRNQGAVSKLKRQPLRFGNENEHEHVWHNQHLKTKIS